MYYEHSLEELSSMGIKAGENKKINLKAILVILFVVYLVFSLIKSWVKLRERMGIVREMKMSVVEEQKKQEDLKRELAQAESDKYIEKQARDKLNMAKEGELIILLPSQALTPSITPTPVDNSANWQKWVGLFL